jgi:hypothetical protein
VGLPSFGAQKWPALAEGIAVQPTVPRPQFVRRIDEIWGVRCACRVCALPCPDLTATLARRYDNLAELGEEDRENKLEVKTVKYLVHGLFARSEKGMPRRLSVRPRQEELGCSSLRIRSW